MILAPTTRRVIRPYDKPSFVHTQRYGLIKGHWANEGRIGLWLFNDLGNIVRDLSGNSNNLDFVNSPVWTSGKHGSAILFNGGSSQYLLGQAGTVISEPLTLMAWGNSNDLTISQQLLSIGDADDSDYHAIRFEGAAVGDYARATSWDGSSAAYAVSTKSYSLNTWHCVCGVFRAVNDRECYLDGGNKGISAATATVIGVDRVAIGITADITPIGPMSGKIGLAMIWNRGLSVGEIAELAYNPFLGIERRTRISYFFVPTAVGGVNYEEFFEDGVGIVDSMSRAQDLSRTITDGVGTEDTIGRTQEQVRTLAETLGLTDTLWKAETRIFADAVGIADVITKVQAFARTIADDIGLIDSKSELMTYVRTLAETLGITDVMSKTVDFPRTISDDVGITDSVTRTAAFARIVAEAMGIADVVTKTQVQLRTIADAMGLTDVMTPGQLVVFAETMGMTDAMAHTKTQIRTFAETMGITDDLTRIAAYIFTQADDVGIADAMVRVAVVLRTINNDMGMTDVMSHQIGDLIKAAWAFMIIRQTHN